MEYDVEFYHKRKAFWLAFFAQVAPRMDDCDEEQDAFNNAFDDILQWKKRKLINGIFSQL